MVHLRGPKGIIESFNGEVILVRFLDKDIMLQIKTFFIVVKKDVFYAKLHHPPNYSATSALIG